MPRLRRVLVLAACTLVIVFLAGLAIADPFHLRHARWFTSALVLLAIILVTVTLLVAIRNAVLRALIATLGAVFALGWSGLVFYLSDLGDYNREVKTVADGARRLVVLEGAPFAIDPVYAVVVRSGVGPFEQESPVYQGVEEGPEPVDVRFIDPNTVQVLTAAGCAFRSEIEGVTLEARPVHRPLTAAGC
ncbi:hypothetical protein [Pseudonocardia sp. TRM90224]|uniref:hypothetical protein n=1 Tax=Pseudonocardia sp. TRM90224 TaxID=2812678 RepID=UPI001E431EAE|nr:hypothetical protein [Pseudonocardia sp. TRM90224]